MKIILQPTLCLNREMMLMSSGTRLSSNGDSSAIPTASARSLTFERLPFWRLLFRPGPCTTNRGDSGRPVLNNKGELIGIISQERVAAKAWVIDRSVHIQKSVNSDDVHREKMSFLGTINVRLSGDFSIPVAINNPVDLNLQGARPAISICMLSISTRRDKSSRP